jgi:phage protein D
MTDMYQNRNGSSFNVTYPDFADFKSPVTSFTLHQEMGKQDVVDLHYKNMTLAHQKALKTGVPVKVKWRNDKVPGTFYGYVHSVTPNINQSLSRTTVVRCIGASLGLKEGGSKIWASKTAPDIVTDIAKKFKLKAVVTKSPVIFSQQSLVGHTYWEKIQELARRIGYVAQVFGTELHFHPIDIMINKSMSVIPILSFSSAVAHPYNTMYSQTLDSFKPKVGDHFDGASYDRKEKTVSGFDPITGKAYSASKSPNTVGKNVRVTTKAPLFKEVLPGLVTGNAEMAKVLAEANAQLSRFSIEAEGMGQGDPRIMPFATVEISGTGSTTDGFWIIKKATHSVYFDGRYELEFSCVADGTGTNKPSAFRPTKAGTAPVRDLYTTTVTTTPTSTKLTGAVAMIRETDAGFKVTPRRWEGR